jgi:hypothetical protein
MTVLINVNTASMQVSLALFHLGNSGFQPLFGEGIEPVLQKPAELIDLLLQIFALFTHGLALWIRRDMQHSQSPIVAEVRSMMTHRTT